SAFAPTNLCLFSFFLFNSPSTLWFFSLSLHDALPILMFRALRLCLLRLLMVPTLICRFILMLLATGWAMGIAPGLGLLATGTICSILFPRWIVLVLNTRSFTTPTAILTGLDS